MSLPSYDFGEGNIAHKIMSAIFGEEWGNMLGVGPGGQLGPLMVDIFTIYNSAVMFVTSVFVGYAIWSGVVQTAHEGKALGKRYSSLWTPLRMVTGATLTAPLFGLSLVQILVLSISAFSFFVSDEISKKVT